jgi:TonB family protein
MRSVIVATLALTPMLLHAQANPPAKTKTSSTSTTLQSKLVQPNELASAGDRGTPAAIRISTGVVAPKLFSTIPVESDNPPSLRGFTIERKTVVEMVVDATGKPSDLKVVQSINPVMDKNVLAAVSQYRFVPGTLDGAPTAVPVNLEVTLRSAAR